MDSAQDVNQGSSATGAAVQLGNLDKMIDSVKPGRPDALAMNKTVRRRIKQFYRSSGAVSFEMSVGETSVP